MLSGDLFTAYRDKSRFGALDGLRCLSIVAVLFHHSPMSRLWADETRLAGRGFLGVDFFFVISGFLITTLMLRERARTGTISLRGFYRRRALRILPLYYLLVTLVGGYYVLIRGSAQAAELWPFYYAFLANMLVDDIPMLSPTWSLSVEEQYYLLWPLLMLVLPLRHVLALVAVFILVSLTMIEAGLGSYGFHVGPLAITWAKVPFTPILLGSCLAIGLHHRGAFEVLARGLAPRAAAPLAFAALVLALVALPPDLSGWPNLVVHLLMTACLGTIVLREDTLLAPVLRFAPIARIGVVSYGIYLLHHIARHVASVVVAPMGGPDANLGLFTLIFWGTAWIMAEISFRGYERHFLALRHKRLDRIKPAPETEGQGSS